MNGKVNENRLRQGQFANIKNMYPEDLFIKRYSNMLNQPLPGNPNKLCSINQYNELTEEHPFRYISPINSYIKVTPQSLVARDLFLSEANLRYRHLESVLPRIQEVNSQLINQSQIQVPSDIAPDLLLRQKHELLKQRELENILLREQLNIQALKLPNLSKYALSLLYNTNKRCAVPQNDCVTTEMLDNTKHNLAAAPQEAVSPVFPITHNALLHEELTRRQHLLEIERDIHILQTIRLEEIMKTTSLQKANQSYLSETNKHQLNKNSDASRLTEYELDALKNAELIRNQKNHGSKTKVKENNAFPSHVIDSSNQAPHSNQRSLSKEINQNLSIEQVNEKIVSCKQSEVDYQPVLKKAKKVCNVCGESSQFICSGCLKSWYCTQACQAKDWKIHNASCGKLKEDSVTNS